MDIGIVRFDRDLDVIQPGGDQLLNVTRVRKPAGIGIQAGDLSILLSVGHEVGQVVAQCGFPASENNVRDAQLPGFVEDLLPFAGGEFSRRDWAFTRGAPEPGPKLQERSAGRCNSGRSRCYSDTLAPGPVDKEPWGGRKTA